MATTFIKYQQNEGFYIAESFMQLVMYFILLEAQKPQYNFSDKQELLEDLKENINGLYSGYLTLYWNELLSGSIDEESMIEVLQNVKPNLQNKGAYITVTELKSIPTEDETLKYMLDKKPFPTGELIRVIDALIQILEGTWISTNYNMDLDWRYYD